MVGSSRSYSGMSDTRACLVSHVSSVIELFQLVIEISQDSLSFHMPVPYSVCADFRIHQRKNFFNRNL